MSKKRTVEVQKECGICHQMKTVLMTEDEYENLGCYLNGEGLIQEMLPDIDYRERELFISGICKDCWTRMLGTPPWEQNNTDVDE